MKNIFTKNNKIDWAAVVMVVGVTISILCWTIALVMGIIG